MPAHELRIVTLQFIACGLKHINYAVMHLVDPDIESRMPPQSNLTPHMVSARCFNRDYETAPSQGLTTPARASR